MRRRMRVGLLAMLVMTSTYIVLPLVPASAVALPPTNYAPVTIGDMGSPYHVLTQPSGGVTLGCGGGTNATKRLDNTGVVTHNLPNTAPYPYTCTRNAVVSADGTLFTVVVNGSNGFTMIQALKDGAVRWTYAFGCMVTVRGMVGRSAARGRADESDVQSRPARQCGNAALAQVRRPAQGNSAQNVQRHQRD